MERKTTKPSLQLIINKNETAADRVLKEALKRLQQCSPNGGVNNPQNRAALVKHFYHR